MRHWRKLESPFQLRSSNKCVAKICASLLSIKKISVTSTINLDRNQFEDLNLIAYSHCHLFHHPHEDAVVLVCLQRVPELDGEGVGLVGQRGEHLVTAGRIVINMGGHSIPTAQHYHYHCRTSSFRGIVTNS